MKKIMEAKGFRNMFVKMAGIEKELEWISAERVNIVITAVVPALLALIGIIIQIGVGSRTDKVLSLLSDDIFICLIQLVLISCTLYVLFNISKRHIIHEGREHKLREYITWEAHMHDKNDENLNIAVHVIKKMVSQFYHRWIIVWICFLLYYGCNLFFLILKGVYPNCQPFELAVVNNIFNNLLNYASSTAMFAIFVILNTATESKRERNVDRDGLPSSYIFISLFACFTIFPSLFSVALDESEYYGLQLFISFVLSVYSMLTFVLLLGKLNSYYLHIPRGIFYGLYCYAIAQIFQFLLMDEETLRWLDMPYHFSTIMGDLNLCFQYITLIGKTLLALALIWVMYGNRFLCYVVQQSLDITEAEYTKQVFEAYLK